ncbi:Proline iminopeptidase [Mycobacterium simulans]|uniref:Proline iminopeptidase n=2 Tax=Mycobacterium simulans TaxID=627089 RepID=A0A7Z7IJ52_9MYCO|nr:Proline iminopeptidase [Mycobacterium simulans]
MLSVAAGKWCSGAPPHEKLLGMSVAIARPKLEGNIAVGEGRQIGFAEFGAPQGRAVFWLHGTPGARRQIPTEARVYAEHHNIRLIGVDRPGIGSSTPHQYETISAFADDLRTIADTLGIDSMAVVGLSGGGPYTLACAAGLPDRVVAAGVLGGVAPTCGPDAISGGLMTLGLRVAPLLRMGGSPLRLGAGMLIRAARPVASPALDVYALLSPQADRHLLARPEFKAMFLDDLLNGSRKQLAAPFADVIAFARDWGFRLDEVKVPVRWWHGDHDHIIPFSHGEHVVSRLPDAELYHLPGESHLAGLGRGEEILATLMKIWDSDLRK